jgi:hypothetical protein
LLRVELRIVHGILLLGFVISHRLFSLRWLTPLSPQRTKAIGPRIRIHSMKANLHHTGRTKSLNSITPSTRITSAQTGLRISVNVSAVSRARDAYPRELWMAGDRVEGQIRMRAVISCCTGVHPGCEQPSSCWVLCVFWLLAPEYFSFWGSPSTIQPTSDVFAERRRYFCGNSVCGSKIAAAFAVQPANAFTFRLECQLTWFDLKVRRQG